MISWHTCNVPQEVVFPRLLYSDSSCSQDCCRRSQVLPDLSSRSQTCRPRSQTCRRRSQTRRWRSQTCCWRSQTCCRHSQTCCRRSQTCCRRSQSCCWCSQTCRRRSLVLPGAPKVLSGALRCSQTYHNHSHSTPVPVIRDPSYSEGRPECPPRV